MKHRLHPEGQWGVWVREKEGVMVVYLAAAW